MAKKPKKKTRYKLIWDKLPGEKKDLYVSLLWKEGYTEQAIADFLHTTKGRVVVHRQRVLKLSSEGRTLKKSARISVENLRDLLDIDEMDEGAMEGVVQTSDIFLDDVPKNEASVETVQRAVKEGKVTELRPIERPTSKTEEVAVPSMRYLPFLPPPDKASRPQSRSAAEGVVGTGCQWPTARGVPCGNSVVPGHKLCQEHLNQPSISKRRL